MACRQYIINYLQTQIPSTHSTATRFRKMLRSTSIHVSTKAGFILGPHPRFLARQLNIATKVLSEEDVIKHDDKQFITHPLFDHPVFTDEECKKITVEHREPKNFGDRLAAKSINFMRSSFDLVTGYKKPQNEQEVIDGFKGTRYEMTAGKWLTRCIFLESVAGVPGMVAASIRHLHSLRLLRRDKAWIETLLDEAYNERMHLLTFIKLGKPSWFTKSIIYVGQGIFWNLFFTMYLVAPKYCHRFVGYLEEEAVSTYTHFIHDLENNKIPEFESMKIPQIAVQYWPQLTEESTMLDLVMRIRADEAKHREVNHTLANIARTDRNPFALQVESSQPQPSYGLETHRGVGWEKEDLILEAPSKK